MGRTYKVIFVLLVVVVAGYAGWRIYESRRASKAGLLSENIVHSGNDWTADFTAMLPAPESEVFNAVRNIENSHSDQIRNIRMLSQTDNSKTVEFEMTGPGGQTITVQVAFQYDPAARRISYHTVDTPALNMKAEYQFDPQGSSTLINYHQVTTMTQQLPVPDSVIKEAIRSIFVAQLEDLKRTLNLTSSEESDESNEEP